jgi:predicted Zn finger-like uncharacterized protein
MKISCQSCQAKYTIADEKVLGKIVKIRCKKCSATIVINGNEQAASPAGGADENVFDYTAQPGSEPWTVNVADGDQRTLTQQEVVHEYRAGIINDETYCWKDGMPDWLPVREIEPLYAACTNRPSLAPELAYAEASPMSLRGDGGAALFDKAETEQVPASMHGNGNGNGATPGLFGSSPPPAASPAPVAARRVGGRAGGGDLFGGVSAAGGEDDVMTSAPVGTPEVQADQKLTGQRNENSVLFSLTALTNSEEKKPSAGTPQNDGSGLIDIRALSANMSDKKDEKNSHVDDIMNLGGGGAFGAALSAPILAPPPVDTSDFSSGPLRIEWNGGGAQPKHGDCRQHPFRIPAADECHAISGFDPILRCQTQRDVARGGQRYFPNNL